MAAPTRSRTWSCSALCATRNATDSATAAETGPGRPPPRSPAATRPTVNVPQARQDRGEGSIQPEADALGPEAQPTNACFRRLLNVGMGQVERSVPPCCGSGTLGPTLVAPTADYGANWARRRARACPVRRRRASDAVAGGGNPAPTSGSASPPHHTGQQYPDSMSSQDDHSMQAAQTSTWVLLSRATDAQFCWRSSGS